MGYTGAYALQAAGQGLQNAGSQIGQALMGVASGQRARQQDMVEEQRYNDAMSMRLAQMKADGQQKKWMREQAEAQQARLDKIRQEEIDMRQAERRLGAVERATRLRTEGHPAAKAVMDAASGMYYVNPGAYKPTATPGYKDLTARGDYYMSHGVSPTGARPTPDTSPRLQTVTTDQGLMTFDPRTGMYSPAMGPGGSPLTRSGGSSNDYLSELLMGTEAGAQPDPSGMGVGAETEAVGYAEEVKELNDDLRAGMLTQEQHAEILAALKQKYGR